MKSAAYCKLLLVLGLLCQVPLGSDLTAAEPRLLVLGVTSWYGRAETPQAFKPFVAYLSEQLQRPVTLYVAKTYADLADRMDRDLVHAGFFPPGAYLQAMARSERLRYLASVLNRHGPVYRGYIITRKDSGVESLRDFRGRSFAFPDKNSTSGYRAPFALFLEVAVDPASAFFDNTFFVGSHAAALRAVAEGQVSGAGVVNYLYDDFEQKDQLRVIAKTPDIPEEAFVVSCVLPPALQNTLQELLLGIDRTTTNQKGERILEPLPYYGFVEKDDSFYQPVRDLLDIFANPRGAE